MTAERLSALFDRISEAPDAIARLRQFVLDLAVRGKLVEQNATDEPPSKVIVNCTARQCQPSGTQEAAFPIPSGWMWVRLGEVAAIVMGQSPPGSTYNKQEGLPLINGPVEFTPGPFGKTVVNQYTTSPTNLCEEGDLLLCVRGSTTGRTNIAAFRACIGRGVAAIRPLIPGRYVHLFIWWSRLSIIGMGRGIAFPSVSRAQIENLRVPLPPVAEQHRIVAKVDELMELCDRLETAQAERETRRKRLVAASLHHLGNGATSEAFHDHARFYINHLPRLTTRSEQVKELRHTILNLGVRGRLVSPSADDEPISDVLLRIRSGASQRASRGLTSPGGNNASAAFSIPASWAWVTLAQLIVFGPQNGISPKPVSHAKAPKAITLTATTYGRFNADHFKHVDADVAPESEFWLKPGDLLFQRGNTTEYVGIAAYYEGEPGTFLYPDLITKVRLYPEISLQYVHIAAISPYARQYLRANATGAQSTMPKINHDTLRGLPIPLPPLGEQRRIVAKVDQLMAICDELESQLTTAQSERRRLLEAVLQEALTSAATQTS